MISFVQSGPRATFSPIDRPTFDALRRKAKAKGVLIPEADSGAVTGVVDAGFSYSEHDQALSIHIIRKPFIISDTGIFDRLEAVFNSQM